MRVRGVRGGSRRCVGVRPNRIEPRVGRVSVCARTLDDVAQDTIALFKVSHQGQLPLRFPNTWGGARRGAGRKPGVRPSTPHRGRPSHRPVEPVHVTLRSRLAPLRSQFLFPVIRIALARANRRDPARFRIVHFSVQRDHLHLLVEAEDKRALSSGMRSVAIRVARYVNDVLVRRGALWSGRWHGRALTSPREVRSALVYVLANFRKHVRRHASVGVDLYSSGTWFDGWRGAAGAPGVGPPTRPLADEAPACPVSPPRTWLVRIGWRRHGLIGAEESPST